MMRLLSRLTNNGRNAVFYTFPIAVGAGLSIAHGVKNQWWALLALGVVLAVVVAGLSVLTYRYDKRVQAEIEELEVLARKMRERGI